MYYYLPSNYGYCLYRSRTINKVYYQHFVFIYCTPIKNGRTNFTMTNRKNRSLGKTVYQYKISFVDLTMEIMFIVEISFYTKKNKNIKMTLQTPSLNNYRILVIH